MALFEELQEGFRIEAFGLLEDFEKSLMKPQRVGFDLELKNYFIRLLTTIKTTGSILHFEEIENFIQEVESQVNFLLLDESLFNDDLVDLFFQIIDLIRKTIKINNDTPFDAQTAQKLIEHLKEFTQSKQGDGQTASPVTKTYKIFFHPLKSFNPNINPESLIDELRQLGPCQVNVQTAPNLVKMSSAQPYSSWEIHLTTDATINQIKDIFIFYEDDSELTIDPLEEDELVQETKPNGSDLKKTAPPSSVGQDFHRHSSLRVSSEKLNLLVNLVGELVTSQAQLGQISSTLNDMDLTIVTERIDDLTSDIRDVAIGLQMLPINNLFNRFTRLSRDLSKELGKNVKLVVEGGETELDKIIIEKLNNPLMHILRNSIDHGIELPEERQALGKPKEGTISLLAYHAGSNVAIRIKDDGKGLDEDTILEKGLQKGLISNKNLDKQEIFSLIFAPGFSTAKAVTDVSGRGVGMDVVKKDIEYLGGSIEINSKKGKGTSLLINIPLTLAIIEGLLVNIGDEKFVIPLASVKECVELTRKDIQNAHGEQIIQNLGHLVPYVSLRDRFSIEGISPEIEQIVIVEVGQQQIGLVVDNVIGKNQTVIKDLGRMYKNAESFSGATILGDGTIALILDIKKLARREEISNQHYLN